METILYVGGFLLLFILCYRIIRTQLGYKTISDRYEWLQVLHHHDWKSGLEMKEDMRKLKKTRHRSNFGGGRIYADLCALEDEKLVERRIKEVINERFSQHEFRLTSSGIRKRAKHGADASQESNNLRTA